MNADAGVSLATRAAADDVSFVLATFTTLTGKPCAKLVPAHSLAAFEAEGVGFAGFAAGGMGQQPRDPDIMAVPDVDSYVALPFVRPGLAMVHCDPHVAGRPYAFAPRVILKAQIEQAAKQKMSLQVGAELEYFLVQRGPTGALTTADSLDRAAQPCYDARGLTRMYDHLTAVSDAMYALGWGPYASDHEDGNGQFEQNFQHADALTTADRVVTARYVIQMLAEQRGMTATFMPKPFSDRTGNGMHLHLSLWDGDRPLFPAEDDHDAHGLGLSPRAYAFIAGLLDNAPALQAVLAPTVNSYKRSGATTTSSGATWAPRTATYGGNDRTHLVRVPDSNRVELRAGDGSACSYLAIAAALAAGLDGIAHDRDPGDIVDAVAVPDAQASPTMPRTLIEAVAELERNTVVRAALDLVDPAAGVSSHYAELKRDEFYAWHAVVSDWEVDRYLTSV